MIFLVGNTKVRNLWKSFGLMEPEVYRRKQYRTIICIKVNLELRIVEQKRCNWVNTFIVNFTLPGRLF